MPKITNLLSSISDEQFIKAIEASHNFTSLGKKLGFRTYGPHGLKIIMKRIGDLKLSTDHFLVRGQWTHEWFKQDLLTSVLVENSVSFKRAKKWVFTLGLLPYHCEQCGLSHEWNSKPLVLQLDHKNGVKTDCRLINLRWLCPNCHSQTDTFSGKNTKKARLNRKLDQGRGIEPQPPHSECGVLPLDEP